ncbi:MAG: type ISP restriction/modification enzyme, partial [Candidatus Acidiferrales bacterium]
HGIVYTPQPIVDFMCASVAEVLEKEFGKSLSSPDVYIIDPCTGTGNFIVNLLRRMERRNLPRMYRQQMFANEVMLLPYYIAALNIEHAYYEITGGYEPFEGLCFVDTLDLAEGSQSRLGFMTEANTQRVARQKQAPITVVIGNPPYNVGQLDENDNNKNRKYAVIDRRVSETYAKASNASNKNALSDPYVKFFRWATDRLQGRDGVVAFVSNNRFVKGVAFDGFRKAIAIEFTEVYHFDLRGDARTTGELRRQEGGNIFHDQIRVGVGVTLLVRNRKSSHSMIHYHVVLPYWRAVQKSEHLRSFPHVGSVPWRDFAADPTGDWLTLANVDQYADFIPIATKEAKSGQSASPGTIFKLFSRGLATSRDDVVYDFQKEKLVERVRQVIEEYNSEVDRYKRSGKKASVDDFVRYDKIKWSRDLKLDLRRGNYASFDDSMVRPSLYRPFCRRWLFFDRILNEEVYVNPRIFPDAESSPNRVIVASDIAYRSTTFSALVTGAIPDLHLCAAIDSHQCFPFYVYDEDGTNRRENITDWALEHFRTHYNGTTITKWDIFYYVYGVLHHPVYREKFAENLKRELPRIPLLGRSHSEEVAAATDEESAVGQAEEKRILRSAQNDGTVFWAVSRAGKELADLHLNYENLDPYPLKWMENRSVPLSYRVEDKMRLSKDKTQVKVNESLTLAGIPPETFEYRLGNRSALEWVIDQYQVTERNGIRSDPNRPGDEQYIVRLVGQVIRVSLETVRLVSSLPPLAGAQTPQEK